MGVAAKKARRRAGLHCYLVHADAMAAFDEMK